MVMTELLRLYLYSHWHFSTGQYDKGMKIIFCAPTQSYHGFIPFPTPKKILILSLMWKKTLNVLSEPFQTLLLEAFFSSLLHYATNSLVYSFLNRYCPCYCI